MSDGIHLVTWRNTYNGDPPGAELDDHRRAAVFANKSFFVWGGEVWFVTKDGAQNTHVDALYLDRGISVVCDERGLVSAKKVEPKKMWLVTSRSYNYDDERYAETEGSHAVRLFDTVEAAEAEAVRLDVAFVVNGNSPFEYLDSGNWADMTYDDLVRMPWPQWQDWLREHGINPPGFNSKNPDAQLEKPMYYQLLDWVHTERWTKEQRKAVAESVNVDQYSVEEIPCGPE